MADWTVEALKLSVPLVISAGLAIFSPGFIAVSRLRRDLAVDVELAAKVSEAQRLELDVEIRRRTAWLIALTRYPNLSRFDLFVVSLSVICTVVMAWQVVVFPLPGDDSDVPGLLPLAPGALVGWALAYWSWSWRAAARMTFLEAHLTTDELAEDASAMKLALLMSWGVGYGIVLLGTGLVIFSASILGASPRGAGLWGFLVFMIPGLLLANLVVTKSPLVLADGSVKPQGVA